MRPSPSPGPRMEFKGKPPRGRVSRGPVLGGTGGDPSSRGIMPSPSPGDLGVNGAGEHPSKGQKGGEVRPIVKDSVLCRRSNSVEPKLSSQEVGYGH